MIAVRDSAASEDGLTAPTSKTTFLIWWFLIFLNDNNLLMLAKADFGSSTESHSSTTAALTKRARLKSISIVAKVLLWYDQNSGSRSTKRRRPRNL